MSQALWRCHERTVAEPPAALVAGERPLDQDLRGYSKLAGRFVFDRRASHLSSGQIVESACVAGFWMVCNTVYDGLHILVEAALLPDASYVK